MLDPHFPNVDQAPPTNSATGPSSVKVSQTVTSKGPISFLKWNILTFIFFSYFYNILLKILLHC